MTGHDPGNRPSSGRPEGFASQPETAAGPPVEELIDLQRALARIPKADRRLLWHAYVERERSKEIAAGLGVAPDAARRRVSRAAQRLRDALGPGYGKETR